MLRTPEGKGREKKTQTRENRERPGAVVWVALKTTVGGDLGLSFCCHRSLFLVAPLCSECHYGIYRTCWCIKATTGCSTRKWQGTVFYRRCTGFSRVTLTPIFTLQLTLNNTGVRGIDHPCSRKSEYNL